MTKRKEKKFITKEISEQVFEIKTPDEKLYDDFMSEYSPDDFQFAGSEFRPGSRVTCPFGLTNGYKMIDGQMVWGYVRIHAGIDQADAETRRFSWGNVRDIVISPFNANRTEIIVYGDTSYGTLNRMYMDKYGFELRVAHMNPKQDVRKGNEKGPMLKWSHGMFKSKKPFDMSWTLGSAGTLGFSSGAHTHSEVKSLDETCEVLDILLEKKFGDKSITEYTKGEVFNLFRKQKMYKEATDQVILNDYNALRKGKKVVFLNRYKCQYIDWDNSIKTRYSITHLFNDFTN